MMLEQRGSVIAAEMHQTHNFDSPEPDTHLFRSVISENSEEFETSTCQQRNQRRGVRRQNDVLSRSCSAKPKGLADHSPAVPSLSEYSPG